MGYGVPAAIAAKVNHRDRLVVCFAGDGDFQMNCQELGSARQAKAQPVILIVNNGIYGTIRMHQEKTYPERISGTEIENPDFSMLAKAYGFHAERVETTADFAAAFERAVGPGIIQAEHARDLPTKRAMGQTALDPPRGRHHLRRSLVVCYYQLTCQSSQAPVPTVTLSSLLSSEPSATRTKESAHPSIDPDSVKSLQEDFIFDADFRGAISSLVV